MQRAAAAGSAPRSSTQAHHNTFHTAATLLAFSSSQHGLALCPQPPQSGNPPLFPGLSLFLPSSILHPPSRLSKAPRPNALFFMCHSPLAPGSAHTHVPSPSFSAPGYWLVPWPLCASSCCLPVPRSFGAGERSDGHALLSSCARRPPPRLTPTCACPSLPPLPMPCPLSYAALCLCALTPGCSHLAAKPHTPGRQCPISSTAPGSRWLLASGLLDEVKGCRGTCCLTGAHVHQHSPAAGVLGRMLCMSARADSSPCAKHALPCLS